MSKKKKFLLAFAGVIVALLNVFVLQYRFVPEGEINLKISAQADVGDEIQVYYSENDEYKESASDKQSCNERKQELVFSVDAFSNYIRIDLGKQRGTYKLSDIYASYRDIVVEIPTNMLLAAENHEISQVQITQEDGESIAAIETSGQDPYLVIRVNFEEFQKIFQESAAKKSFAVDLLIVLIIDACFLIVIKNWKKVTALPAELIQNRRLIMTLSKNDFKTKYAGSYLGIVWAFVQPVVTILVYWFVFQVGFRSSNVSEFPFVLYLTTGIIPWFFFQDALNGGTNALIEYNYLVKKVVFKISILPIVKIISAAFVHVFFVCCGMFICALYGYWPSVYSLQLIYYFVCNFVLVLGLVYATSAIVIFFRDLTQIISIFLQVGIWMTPIMWDIQMLDKVPWLMKLFRLNPMYYIVTGYRDSMLGHVGISAHMIWTVYFWVLTAILFIIGTIIFKRL